MRNTFRIVSLLLALCMLTGIPCAFAESDGVIDDKLTCTITLGNWPPDTAPAAEKALFENYKAIMAKQYPNVTLVPNYYSYTLSNYVTMAIAHTAPSIFQPPFTDPQLLISQGLVGDVTDALKKFGVLDQFSPSYVEMLADENGRIYGLPRDGYVLGMHINLQLFREAGLVTEDGLPMYPKTLQELAEYGKIIREKTQGGSGFPRMRGLRRMAVHQHRLELRLRRGQGAGVSGRGRTLGLQLHLARMRRRDAVHP